MLRHKRNGNLNYLGQVAVIVACRVLHPPDAKTAPNGAVLVFLVLKARGFAQIRLAEPLARPFG